jgi:hypothetical protein
VSCFDLLAYSASVFIRLLFAEHSRENGLWIMLRDQIDYEEFCRRGKLLRQSGEAHAGMPDFNSGPARQ